MTGPNGTESSGIGSEVDPSCRYVDHPGPSVTVVAIHFGAIALLILGAVPEALRSVAISISSFLPILIVGLIVSILAFYSWPLFQTYYVMSRDGINVRYGPWRHKYTWSEFDAASWQRGLFALRIGVPSITPCVRMTDAIVLRRTLKRSELYLTPNDPRAFLAKVVEFAPDLMRETVL